MFHWLIEFMKSINGIKKYYNSISRQSGIVHKDKAMRQLDLDLWEMNWLVAGERSPLMNQAILIDWWIKWSEWAPPQQAKLNWNEFWFMKFNWRCLLREEPTNHTQTNFSLALAGEEKFGFVLLDLPRSRSCLVRRLLLAHSLCCFMNSFHKFISSTAAAINCAIGGCLLPSLFNQLVFALFSLFWRSPCRWQRP